MASLVDDRLLVQYLVGDCSDDERTRVEERFFTDEETFERLCELEEDLAWRYARGELNATERERVERAYAVPPRRDRLILTIALGRILAEPPKEPVRALTPVIEAPTADGGWWMVVRNWLSLEPAGARLVLAAACAALVIGLGVQMQQARALRATLAQSRHDSVSLRQQAEGAARRASESERRIAALTEQIARAQPATGESPAPARRPVFATFVLMPGRTRSAREPAQIAPPRNADTLRLQLNLDFDSAYASFKAELRTSAGDLLWSQDRLQAQKTGDSASVALTIPAALVTDGEYELLLQGRLRDDAIEDAASYYFTVAR
jgi:hypothetical protein